MADVDVTAALRGGAERTVARNGLMILAAYFLINMTGTFLGQDAALNAVNPASVSPVIVVSYVFLSIALTILSVWVSIIAIRTFVSDETETVPDEFVHHDIGRSMIHMILGGIVFAIALGVGLALFVVPGVYLLISLFFWSVYVVTEETSFIEGMQRSWDLVEGHRWSLLAIAIALLGINLVIGAVVAQVGTTSMPAVVVTQALSAVGGTYLLATQGRVYNQLTA